ncbi:MAG: HAMP domain-containing sensor histidine kinase, partial [Myxococcota bacterium]
MARVLHIEKDEGIAGLVHRCLQDTHGVEHTPSGVVGARRAAAAPPDLVLIGRDTSDLDGYETVLRIRAHASLQSIPVVLMADDAARRACIAAGADGVVRAPPDALTLADDIARYLAGHREDLEGTGEIDLREHSHRIVARLEEKVLALSEANAGLEEAARLRRAFLRTVTHELATPMTPIVGYLKLLQSGDLGEVSPLQQKGLSAIGRSVTRLHDMIDTLLDVSAFERGRLHFYERSYDFCELARGAVERAQVGGPEHVHVQFSAAQPTLALVGDPEKTRRAMVHVLQNALKFSPRGAPVRVEARRVGAHAEFRV